MLPEPRSSTIASRSGSATASGGCNQAKSTFSNRTASVATSIPPGGTSKSGRLPAAPRTVWPGSSADHDPPLHTSGLSQGNIQSAGATALDFSAALAGRFMLAGGWSATGARNSAGATSVCCVDDPRARVPANSDFGMRLGGAAVAGLTAGLSASETASVPSPVGRAGFAVAVFAVAPGQATQAAMIATTEPTTAAMGAQAIRVRQEFRAPRNDCRRSPEPPASVLRSRRPAGVAAPTSARSSANEAGLDLGSRSVQREIASANQGGV